MKIEFDSLKLFLGLVTYKVTPTDYTLLSFVLLLKNALFQRQNATATRIDLPMD